MNNYNSEAEFICPHCFQSITKEDLQTEKQMLLTLQQYKKQVNSLKEELEQEKAKNISQKELKIEQIKINHNNRIKWSFEEDLYCVNRFIEHYFERLIKYGNSLNSEEINWEVNLYTQDYGNKRSEGSVILKFHNIEHLAFKFVEKNGNPYNIEIKKGMSGKSKQSLKSWRYGLNQYAQDINKWLNKK